MLQVGSAATTYWIEVGDVIPEVVLEELVFPAPSGVGFWGSCIT